MTNNRITLYYIYRYFSIFTLWRHFLVDGTDGHPFRFVLPFEVLFAKGERNFRQGLERIECIIIVTVEEKFQRLLGIVIIISARERDWVIDQKSRCLCTIDINIFRYYTINHNLYYCCFLFQEFFQIKFYLFLLFLLFNIAAFSYIINICFYDVFILIILLSL